MYKVMVEFAPIYELATSLEVYLQFKRYKQHELPADWLTQVHQQISPALAERLAKTKNPPFWNHLALLIWQCPTQDSFLKWYGSRSPGELYELLTPRARELPKDLGTQRDSDVEILSLWQEQYFRHVDPRILTGLAANASALAERAQTEPPTDLIEQATMGMWVPTDPAIKEVLLVPQHHFRPWTIPCHFQGMRIYGYPADVLPPAPGEPGAALLRLTRALADESRLKILRFLASGDRTFTDVLHFSGLAKGTVNHHLVALRAAGLVRIDDTNGHNRTYSLRPGALQAVGARLADFAYKPE